MVVVDLAEDGTEHRAYEIEGQRDTEAELVFYVSLAALTVGYGQCEVS